MTNYQIIKFKDGEFELDVNVSLEENTVWLTRDQIAKLLNKDRSVIVKQIKKIYEENKLDKKSTCAKNAQVQIEGNRSVNRIIDMFNLDVISYLDNNSKSPRIELFKTWALSLQNNSFNAESINYIDNKYEIVKFKDGIFELDVNISPFKNDVYLSQKQMAELFEVSSDNISLHIKNILKEEEFDEPVSEESSVTACDGKTYKIKIYNLDMIFAVGTRVKSRRGILFKEWALNILEAKNKLNKNIRLEKNKFYANFATGKKAHPSLIFETDYLNDKYKALSFDTSEGKHRIEIKPIEKNIKKSFVKTRPILGIRKDFSSHEWNPKLKIDPADYEKINFIKKQKPQLTANYKKKNKKSTQSIKCKHEYS